MANCEVRTAYRCSTYERTVATMRVVDWTLPAEVTAGEPFTIQIRYRLDSIETRDPGNNLQYFPPIYDGICTHVWSIIHLQYWVWRLAEMGLTLIENPPAEMPTGMAPGETKVNFHNRFDITAGDTFTYTFTGTIEQLLGRQFNESTVVNLAWSVYGLIWGMYEPDDLFPWNWNPTQEFTEFSRVTWLPHQIQVNVPPPPPPEPYPQFDRDRCSISKDTVAPTESFDIRITIDNRNETSGTYYIVCYCEGEKLQLATGTIAGGGTEQETIPVTANELAQAQITEDRYLTFVVAVENEEEETDRLQVYSITVTLDGLGATLSGMVTDKLGQYLAGVAVSIPGQQTSTDTYGAYTLEGLDPGTYEVTFQKAGYWPVTKTKKVVEGSNTLNVEMTPDTEPEPGISWPTVLGAVAVITGVVIIAKGGKRHA